MRNEKKLSIERIGRNRKNDKNADSGFRDILSDTWIGVLFSFEKWKSGGSRSFIENIL